MKLVIRRIGSMARSTTWPATPHLPPLGRGRETKPQLLIHKRKLSTAPFTAGRRERQAVSTRQESTMEGARSRLDVPVVSVGKERAEFWSSAGYAAVTGFAWFGGGIAGCLKAVIYS
ncbi:hypothetical protein K432DRAFT_392870 [Lepidopterella palustris CBS 459.81]|uniref:Uncharacterized protein n=1 Tax=Lepidopterella palustris CBS 459.81 TaxID=1314670 RepID=A0A8E2EAW9_9PEZI|nr:hypothetical protein K432DRAFT_392870 [Lepidopterella palustris CBS 459.81]